jgi:hypothetical protein
MKFGIIKSKIDYVLSESFKNELHFKEEMKLFKKVVLENKTLSKLFYLYDELSTKKNVNKNIVNEYINESITIYENLINKIKPSDLKKLNTWLIDVNVENNYGQIDDLFSNDILKLENKIQSKKTIAESLTEIGTSEKEVINIPVSSMIKLANKTLNNFIQGLNEGDKQELIKFLSQDEQTMEGEYNVIKEDVIGKLNNHKRGSDEDTSNKIEETISKIKNEKFDKLTFFKLKNLNESL